MPSLVLAEKKTEQEELKLERARDSSEGESQGYVVRGSPGLPAPPGHPTDAVPTSRRLLLRRGQDVARLGHPLAPRCAPLRPHQVCHLHLQGEREPPPCRATHGCWELLGGGARSRAGAAPGAGAPVSPARSPQGTTGEVHCEKVQCPRLTCANPVRASPSDCCKQCPGTCSPLLPSPVSPVPPRGCSSSPCHLPQPLRRASPSWLTACRRTGPVPAASGAAGTSTTRAGTPRCHPSGR